MPDELPPTDPVPGAPEPARARRLTCDFCGCSLAPTGEVMRMSDDAKKYRDHGDTLAKRDVRISDLETEVRALKAELAAATPKKARLLDDL